MSENQQNWIVWARALERWEIKNGVASLLEIAGSLNVLLAQVLYLSQPVLIGTVPSSSLSSLAQLLENPDHRQEFISFLREAPDGGTSA